MITQARSNRFWAALGAALILAVWTAACAAPATQLPPPTAVPSSTPAPTETPVPATGTPVPTPTIEPSPTKTPEVPIDPNLAVGIWRGSEIPPKIKDTFILFREDGFWAVVTYTGNKRDESIFETAKQFGTYVIDGMELVLSSDPEAFIACDDKGAGRYHVFFREENLIYFKIVEDHCLARSNPFAVGTWNLQE